MKTISFIMCLVLLVSCGTDKKEEIKIEKNGKIDTIIRQSEINLNAAQKAFVNYLGINSLSIYERNKRFQYNYFSPNKRDGENLFNEDFGIK